MVTALAFIFIAFSMFMLNLYMGVVLDQMLIRYMHAQWVNHTMVFHKNCDDIQFRIGIMKLGEKTEPELAWGMLEIFKLRRKHGYQLVNHHRETCPFCNKKDRDELIGRRVFSK